MNLTGNQSLKLFKIVYEIYITTQLSKKHPLPMMTDCDCTFEEFRRSSADFPQAAAEISFTVH